MSETFVARIRREILSQHLVHREERVMVGVSGGADSVALLHVFVQLQPALRLTLCVIHVDHQLRPDSAADAAFVQALAARFKVPTVMEQRDVGALCRANRWSLEEGARRIRYETFLEAAARWSANVVALAHTADDQAETVLMRLLRGSGLTGLAGIPSLRETNGIRIVRPLLACWRQEILDYLASAGLTYRQDASNEDRRFLRNRIRHELLPLLARDYNPNIKQALIQLAGQSRVDGTYLAAAARRHWKRMATPLRRGEIALKLPALARQPQALQRQLVRQALRQLQGDLNQFEFRHWVELERLLGPGAAPDAVDLPGGVRVVRKDDRLCFQR
jgi:tRNA(Ile)-lysidine synthase